MRLSWKIALAAGAAFAAAGPGYAQEGQATEKTAAKRVYEQRFAPGEKAGFLGIFTHTETISSLEEKYEGASKFLESNPYLAGVTIKIQWYQLHPEKDVVKWDELEKLIDLIASHGKLINFVIFAGYWTPDWVYAEGAEKIDGGRGTAPAPWDPVYVKLFSEDLREIAKRYADDPRIFMFGVNGHNYQGEEMHGISPSSLPGYSREKVLDNYKYWIDLHNELFPNKWLSVVISQMYSSDPDLPDDVIAYFIEKCQGRAVLQTHQLNGREDVLSQSSRICQEYADRAPHCHEMVGSFKEQADRQGTPEMTVYNFAKLGNPLYMQIWARDAYEPQYAKALLDAWDTYGGLSPEDMKAKLQADGKFSETSSWRRGGAPQAGAAQGEDAAAGAAAGRGGRGAAAGGARGRRGGQPAPDSAAEPQSTQQPPAE